MITEERILKVLRAPHISEKATMAAENGNTIVFKVAMTATKKEIKAAVEKLFEVEVKSVNTLIVKVRPNVKVCAKASFRREESVCNLERRSRHRLRWRR